MGNPVTFADPSPVGTGPYMLDKFSPQGFTLKINPFYRDKSTLHVPVIDFPSYNTNANLVPPIQSGSIDWAGNYVTDIQGNYLSKSPENHTWLSSAPYFNANNVVSLFLNTQKAPLSDPAVRQAIEFGINRQQLSTQAETGYELPASSSSGLMLPAQSAYQDPALANNLPAAGDAAKVASILQADGYAKVNGKWSKNGKTIAFKISDPIPYSDYYTADQLIAHQLNTLGFNVTVDGIGNPTVWAGDVANGTFDSTIHWSNQGPTPYRVLQRLDGQQAERPDRQARHGRLRPVLRLGCPAGPGPVRELGQQHPAVRRHHQAAAGHDQPGAGGSAAVRRCLGRILDPQLHRMAIGERTLHDAGAEHPLSGIHGSSAEAEVLTR